MLVPINWLKKYVEIEINNRELADKLTMSGTHVDSIKSINNNIKNVVVGRILEIENHPNADKLKVTKVDIGCEVLQIVTGAPNIRMNALIAVAIEDAILHGNVAIKESDFRGIKSQGMMCSYEELGFADSVIPKEFRDGILIFNESEDLKIGDDINKVLGLNETILDIEITHNRPDCLSMIGIAREVAAATESKFKYPEVKTNTEEDDIYNYFNEIKIEAPDLCKRYYAKVIKDIKIEPSPLWLQRALMDAGMRPISNIVDVTNYVMLEMGQPLHAFDLEKLNGRKIIVKRAEKNEKFKTLDNVERNLDDNILAIADENGTTALAGVMGGLFSEITDETKVMLLESANFNSKSIRHTSKKLGLRSEASSRFEKGLQPESVVDACERACQLIEMLGAGTVIKGSIDVGEKTSEIRDVNLRPDRVERLLGVKIDIEEMINTLNSLGIESTLENGIIVSKIPYYRADIEQEADLIEEVGRIYGFHNIESAPLKGQILKGSKSYKRLIEDRLKSILTGLGLYEITTYSFISPKSYDKICLGKDDKKRNIVKIINPLGEDYSVMRSTLIPNMTDVIARNINHGVQSAILYEIGNIFIPKSLPVTELPCEKSTICIGAFGNCDYYKIKGIVEQIMERLGIECEYNASSDYGTFHGGRTAEIIIDNEKTGIIGELHPDVNEKYGLKTKVYIAEIDVEFLVKKANFNRKYKSLPKYPAVSRDISVVIKEEISVGEIEKVIYEADNTILENIKLFDVYRGNPIDKGYKSVAFSLTYRHMDYTLKDEEVNIVHQNILSNLENKLGAILR